MEKTLSEVMRSRYLRGKDDLINKEMCVKLSPRSPKRASDLAAMECVSRVKALDRAHKFVLDKGFTEYAALASKVPPSTLMKLFDVARPPFETMWIEWDEPARVSTLRGGSSDHGLPERVGVLIQPNIGPQYKIEIYVESSNGGVFGIPIGLYVNFAEPAFLGSSDHLTEKLTEMSDEERQGPFRHMGIGSGYLSEIRRLHGEAEHLLGLQISRHMFPGLCGPTGEVLGAAFGQALSTNPDLIEQAENMFRAAVKEINGDGRWITTVIGLLNLSRSEVRVDTQAGVRPPSSPRYRPAYEHRVVTLRRPNPNIATALIRAGKRGGISRRWHTVMGHWCFSKRTGRSGCSHTYVHQVDDQGVRVGSDRYVCESCGHKKWWRKNHGRGSREEGVIDKSFEITTDRVGEKGRSFVTDKVVDHIIA